MKIAYIGKSGIDDNRVDKYTQEIASRMAKKGHRVFVFAKEYNSINALTQNFDLVHFTRPTILGLLFKIFSPRTALISTFFHGRNIKIDHSGFKKKFLKLSELLSFRFSDAIITTTKSLYDHYLKKYHLKSIVISDGIEMTKLNNSDYLKKYSLQKNDYLIYVGRLIRSKGARHLIDAFKNLEDKHLARGKKLVIVGKGSSMDSYEAELKDMSRGRENIIFTGELEGEELDQVLGNSYMFIHPSKTEDSFSMVLKAMSYGKAIISSDMAKADPLDDNTSVLFKSGNIYDLEDRLVTLINNPLIVKEMGEMALEKVRKEYGWDAVTDRIAMVYQEAYASKNKSRANIKLHGKNI